EACGGEVGEREKEQGQDDGHPQSERWARPVGILECASPAEAVHQHEPGGQSQREQRGDEGVALATRLGVGIGAGIGVSICHDESSSRAFFALDSARSAPAHATGGAISTRFTSCSQTIPRGVAVDLYKILHFPLILTLSLQWQKA